MKEAVADTPTKDSLVKKEPDPPAPDPIVSRTTSSILLVCALLLMASLGWALYDEVYGQRPWRNMQRSFAQRYERFLKRLKNRPRSTEQEVRESPEFQQLDAAVKEEEARIRPRDTEIARRVAAVERQLAAITDPYQDKRGRITVINYEIETAHGESDKREGRERAERVKNEQVAVDLPAADGSNRVERQRLNYSQLDQMFTRLRDEKSALLTERAELVKTQDELRRKRDTYLKDNMVGVSTAQVDALLKKTQNFDFSMRQVAVNGETVVDRCETCHLGIREPITITAGDMMSNRRRNRPDRLARAFVSHPQKELLQIHKPEQFGCSSCHGGNGRATTSVEKAHGLNRFWLHPMHRRENAEAGCQQCHSQDRVLDFAPTLNLGKDLYYERGCVGCHRYEGFDRESDSLAGARQQIKQLEEQRDANEREAKQAAADAATAPDDAAAQRLLARVENLRVYNSQIEARMDQLNTQARYLMQDQKKVGPNLKDVRLKLRREWIPVWLQDPQKFRPGTKMPTYWRIDGEGGTDADRAREEQERKAIAAFLWQESFDGRVARQPQGDAGKGRELFESRGCLACHSIGEPGQAVGGDFAANLTRVGEKASYDYIVRWIHNPRERWQPYCPTHKRDLTPEDYAKHNKPFVFNGANSRCPEDGAELQVQNMTVMPNFRLSEQDTRDIATYLFSLARDVNYPDASYMEDPALKEQGRALIKTYGCAGCHEMRGFEDEQRIGKDLTTEGATPIERLDFALLTHDAERGVDPYDPQHREGQTWYNRRGFFEHKLREPGIYDRGKEKEAKDMLRMPRPYLTDEWRNALVTFLLGSVGREGANVPASMFFNATDRQRDIQEGWWVIKKYNCMGCHSIQVGQRSTLSSLAAYAEGGALGRDHLPPGLMTEGARVNPNWLLSFLRDPSLSGRSEEELTAAVAAHGGQTVGASGPRAAGGQQGGGSSGGTASNAQPGGNPNERAADRADARAGTLESPPNAADVQQGPQARDGYLTPQPGENSNGVRTYMKTRMPTFNFSPNELRALVRFFQAVSSQQEPYIQEQIEPLSGEERELARALFTSAAAPCLKCHVTGDPVRDQTASAPNFLQAGGRLKKDWTVRWLLDPQRIMPGTAMPSGLFKKEGERWVFNGPVPESAANYGGDHAELLARYMLLLTADERGLALPPREATGVGGTAAEGGAPEGAGCERAVRACSSGVSCRR
ncbi:MAG TPA: c-type cytochrome [Pyrinomonadaceae bacterium]|nr:c-type cytochrome [Pyrinomonadaceae bacterium]